MVVVTPPLALDIVLDSAMQQGLNRRNNKAKLAAMSLVVGSEFNTTASIQEYGKLYRRSQNRIRDYPNFANDEQYGSAPKGYDLATAYLSAAAILFC